MGITSVLLKGARYTKRALNLAPEFLLGESALVYSKSAKTAKGSIFSRAKAGILDFEKEVAAKKAAQGGFLKRLWHNTTHFAQDIYHDTKAAKSAAMRKVVSSKSAIAKMAAKGKTTEKAVAKAFVRKQTVKGFGKAVMKKMPFIGQIMTIACEVPNIFRAAKDEGIGTALKESAWAAGELSGFAIGTAIGSFICPGIGSIIGGIVGGMAVAMFRGESYSDKKERLINEYGVSEEDLSAAQKEGYKVDDIIAEFDAVAAEEAEEAEAQAQGQAQEADPVQGYSQENESQSAAATQSGGTQQVEQEEQSSALASTETSHSSGAAIQQNQNASQIAEQQHYSTYYNPYLAGTFANYQYMPSYFTPNYGFNYGGYGLLADSGYYNPYATLGFTPFFNTGFSIGAYPQFNNPYMYMYSNPFMGYQYMC